MKIKKAYSKPVLECEFQDMERMRREYKYCKANVNFSTFVRLFYSEIISRPFLKDVIWSDNEFGMIHLRRDRDLILEFTLCRTFIFKNFFTSDY